MAKNKAPLTPEQAEVKAMKKANSSQNFIKFIAVVLALVLTVGVVFVGKSTADKAIEAAGQVQQGGTSTDGGNDDVVLDDGSDDVILDETPSGDDTVAGDDATAGDDAPAAGDDAPAAGDDASAAPSFSKANAHEMLNKWTANAAKMSYKWKRVSAYTADGAINVGSATSLLNGIISGIDENASLDSVVGGFLGIGNKEGEVKNGAVPEDMNKNYVLKAMALTAGDVLAATANGNTYKVQIANCTNPQKDGKNALSRATNDFFTHQEAADGIAGLTSAITLKETNVEYTSIVITAVVDGDALKSLDISYTFSASLTLKAGFSINGKGKATNKITYTF